MLIPLLLFIIFPLPLLGAEALASRLFLFSFILSLMSSRLSLNVFFCARSFAIAQDLQLFESVVNYLSEQLQKMTQTKLKS